MQMQTTSFDDERTEKKLRALINRWIDFMALEAPVQTARCRITARTSLGRTATFKIALICVVPMMLRPSGSPSNSLMVATWSYGNWIARSRRLGTRQIRAAQR